MVRLSVPYRDSPLPAYFGTSTSRANFCEEDFIVTGYIAEFVNTLTNIAYILYALHNLRHLWKKEGTFSSQILYYGLIFVGVSSGLFHALLKYYAQMGDDVSMLVATGCVLHRAMTFDKDAAYRRNYTTVLLAVLSITIAYHCITDELVVHQLAFAVLLVLTGLKTRALVHDRVDSPATRAKLMRIVKFGAGSFTLGYILWQIDENFCPQLTALRRYVGLPWGFLFELHGWWHILTAVGAYTFMAMVEQLTGESDTFHEDIFAWPLKSVIAASNGRGDRIAKDR